MAKTNKEIRWDLASKYHDELTKVDDTLEFFEKSWYSKEEIKSTRERLISNLQTKLEKEDGYEEARATHRAELKAKWFVEKEKEEKEKLQRKYEEKMAEAGRDMSEKSKTYEDAQVAHRWKVEDKVEVEEWVKEGKWLESLRWNKEEILKSLKENPEYVKIEENAEVMWHTWKKVHINLPKVWNFEWFKFDYFVSYNSVEKKDFEKNPKLEKKSYSMNDVSNLLKAINRFMAALGCETDWIMKYWETKTITYDVWYCLKAITWLSWSNSWYWLSDKNVAWRKGSRAEWVSSGDWFIFKRQDGDYDTALLFLRLSD